MVRVGFTYNSPTWYTIYEETRQYLETSIIEDFTQFSKEDLVTQIANLQKDINLKHISSSLRNLKVRFDELFEKSKANALSIFLQVEGAEADDFFYKGDIQMFFQSDKFQTLKLKKLD